MNPSQKEHEHRSLRVVATHERNVYQGTCACGAVIVGVATPQGWRYETSWKSSADKSSPKS